MPYFRQLLPFTAQDLLQACHRLPDAAMLYSGLSGHPREQATNDQRWAILAFSADQRVVAHTAEQWQQLTSTLTNAQENLASCADNPHPADRFISGWIGYFSYDAGELTIANLAGRPEPVTTPLAEFHHYDASILLEPDLNQAWLRAPAEPDAQRLQQLLQLIEQAVEASQTADSRSGPVAETTAGRKQWTPAWDAGAYEQAFDALQEYISAGDVYQVNLTLPFNSRCDFTDRNPTPLLQHFDAPFSCYFRTGALTLFSVSPERFVKLEDNRIVTSPIKGTAPRGKTPAEDAANRQWLADSEKNQAENLMIVDLLRNDLGRSATPGSVRVDKLFDIESHANVHHMVSTISADIAPGQTRLQAVLNAFPGGSITGAPKKRAMEIIAELEPQRRNLYCGSFGYFSDQGVADFNILIRSIVATPNGAQCWGGGGIVKDSTAASEYSEVFAKVQRIFDCDW